MDYIPSLGVFPSPEDKRDLKYNQVVATASPTELPLKFLNEINGFSVFNQLALGACVGHGTAQYERKLQQPEVKTVLDFNPRFVYALCKMLDANPEQQGTWPRLAMKVLKSYGCATTKYFPNDTTLPHEQYIDLKQIPQEAYDEATQYKIESFASIDIKNINEVKQAICKDGGFIITMYVDKKWWSNIQGVYSFDEKDILPLMPPDLTTQPGAHLIWCYGYEYDEVVKKHKVYILNSWGENWAHHGTGWFYFEDYVNCISEGWIAVDRPNNYDELMTANMRKITHLLVHHTASSGPTTTLAGVNEYHRTKNWGTTQNPVYGSESNLGYFVQYHYFITWDGKVTQTRQDYEIGWHGNNANPFSLGICLAGWFDKGHDESGPSQAQITSLAALLKTLAGKYAIPAQNIVPHRKFNPTKSCYGALLNDTWASNLVYPNNMPKKIPFVPYFEKLPNVSAVYGYDADTETMLPISSGRAFKIMCGSYKQANIQTVNALARPVSQEVLTIQSSAGESPFQVSDEDVKILINQDKETIDHAKRYIVSSGVTFIASFLVVFGSEILTTGVDMHNLSWALIGSFALTAIRAGIKAAVEYLSTNLK